MLNIVAVIGCHQGMDCKQSSYPNELQGDNHMQKTFMSTCSVPGPVLGAEHTGYKDE